MIIKPKIRGFLCVTAHPVGCDLNVKEQIDYVKKETVIENGPKNVLIIGASTGYGLSSRIVSSFGCKAKTLGVFFERSANNGRPASAGWYNTVALEKHTQEAGLYTQSINGDAFSNELKDQTISKLKEEMKSVDLVIYSLAAPARTDPETGTVYKSHLKPIGSPFTGKTVNTDKDEIFDITIDSATEEEINSTVKVMGGEDWERWIKTLSSAGLLADKCKTIAYSYIGPEVTWPIYTNGTIGQAKKHLDATAKKLNKHMETLGGNAYVSVNKAVVTQASSAIPVVSLYNSLLSKVLEEKGLQEGCTEQTYRLFSQCLYNNSDLILDDESRIRIDDLELREDVQSEIKRLWPSITTENLYDITNYKEYSEDFLKLFGFGLKEIDYNVESEIELDLPTC